MALNNIPVIDLFAGPGGLSEGFSSLADSNGQKIFDVRVSIEKDLKAYETLRLRAFFRAFPKASIPDCYYDYLRGDIQKEDLVTRKEVREEWQVSGHEAHHAVLGEHDSEEVDGWIREAIGFNNDWVLIGGPPCQAYSTVGRARMRNGDPDAFELDKRHFLYKEYLRIIQKFQPAVFVMENVKGMLSSTHGGARIFDRIRADLSRPKEGLEYELRSFVRSEIPHKPMDFVIEAEKHGVPQTRHRVIIFGVRSDLASGKHRILEEKNRLSVRETLSGIPPVRSRLSLKFKPKDSFENWLGVLKKTPETLHAWDDPSRGEIEDLIHHAIQLAEFVSSIGGRFIPYAEQPNWRIPQDLLGLIRDPKLDGICQHETRSHMPKDLHRYMFASCYTDHHGVSPKLRQFPTELLPEHKNVDGSARTAEVPFEDRFRVQPWRTPSTTILSHMAKDGHYFIHPDASQCRSLTVREAARLQTFPDNYFFEGNKIDQYTQVGNAVPPFLAKQIAEVVAHFLGGHQQTDQTFHEASLEPESLVTVRRSAFFPYGVGSASHGVSCASRLPVVRQ